MRLGQSTSHPTEGIDTNPLPSEKPRLLQTHDQYAADYVRADDGGRNVSPHGRRQDSSVNYQGITTDFSFSISQHFATNPLV